MRVKKPKSKMAKYRTKIATHLEDTKDMYKTKLHNSNPKSKGNGDWLKTNQV